MPDYRDSEGRITFNSKLTHEVGDKRFVTIIEPFFTRVDSKRFTKEEWERYLSRKVYGLRAYMEQIAGKESCRVQLVVVCEDMEDFKKIATVICNVFPEHALEQIYYTAEGALKSVNYDIRQSMVRITSLKQGSDSMKLPGSVSSQLAYSFF